MSSTAATEALMQDSADILSLAVKLSQQQGGGGGVDLELLLSQMKTFFAAGGWCAVFSVGVCSAACTY